MEIVDEHCVNRAKSVFANFVPMRNRVNYDINNYFSP
jgi:hypothetical protein